MAQIDQIEQALSYIDSTDRETWVSVGNALKGELGSNALDIWLNWSEGAASFNRKAALSTWKSIKKLVVPIGYVFKLAIQNGYQPDKSAYKPQNPQEKAAKQAERDRAAKRAEQEASQSAEQARIKSLVTWKRAMLGGSSEYLMRKQLDSEIGAHRYLDHGSIVVPMIRYDFTRDQAFVGLQTIKSDGTKLFPAGVAKSGSSCRVGEPSDTLICVCEGYATGLSIRIAMNYLVPVYVAFDAGNMVKVAHMLRDIYPNPHILVCADNDQKTKNNPGIKAGFKAIKKLQNSSIIYPIFAVGDTKNSDFNDLHVAYGLTALSRQFLGIKQAFKTITGAHHG
jgi:putative DNA primase/helicase